MTACNVMSSHATAPDRDRRPAAIPRSYWTTERWGHLLAGGTIGLCLAAGWWWPTSQILTWTLVGAIAVQLVVTSLAGWCPLHELLRWFGIPDREEIYARLQQEELYARLYQTKK